MKKFLIATVAAAILAPISANAATFTGRLTVNDPNFNRPNIELDGSLNIAGNAANYDVVDFHVDTTGSYTLNLDRLSATLVDPVLYLYQGSFNPASPLDNALAANNDRGSWSVGDAFTLNYLNSTISTALTAGVDYFAVITSFSSGQIGNWELDITGAGNVIGGQVPVIDPGTPGAVPEAATWAMMIMGFGMVGASMRRRQSVSARKLVLN